jgi:hypothetical protein
VFNFFFEWQNFGQTTQISCKMCVSCKLPSNKASPTKVLVACCHLAIFLERLSARKNRAKLSPRQKKRKNWKRRWPCVGLLLDWQTYKEKWLCICAMS